MSANDENQDRIDKLIAFFKNLKIKKPDCNPADYSSWNQTEEEYQKQQAAWMKEVAEMRKKDRINRTK